MAKTEEQKAAEASTEKTPVELPANLSMNNAAKYAGKESAYAFFCEVCAELGAGDPNRFPALKENGVGIKGLTDAAKAGSKEAQAAVKRVQAVFERARG